jgi:hypothetical protein
MTATMIRPFVIDDDALVSTNAVDTTPAWGGATNYGLGDKVQHGDRIFFSRISDNLNKEPPGNGTTWTDNGPINPLAMFDGSTSTQTQATGELTVVLQLTGWLDGLALFDLVGNSMQVIIEDGTVEVYNETFSLLDDEMVVDFYTYLFEELTYVRDFALLDLPLTPNAKVTIKITGGGTVKCGALVVGSSLQIGESLQGSTAGVEDFSVVERNAFGTLFITPRNTAKEGSFEVVVPDGRGPSISNAFRDLGRRVAVFVMAEGDSRAVILGYLRMHKFTWGQRNDERLTMDIGGVT